MLLSRRVLLGLLVCGFVAGCGGGILSVLRAQGKAKGGGDAEVLVKNLSGTGIERLHVAKTADVDRARAGGAAPGSSADQALWGEDQLGNAGIAEGQTFTSLTLPEDRYDVLVTDHDGREQLVKGLKLRAGRKYTLEIGDAWTMGR